MARYCKGHKHSEKVKKKIFDAALGRVSPFLGKRHSEEAKRQVSSANKRNMLGKTLSGETRRKISIANLGSNNPNWQGGIACEPYCDAWADQEYKDDIKERDNHTCQNPSCHGNCDHLPLNIHHINHDTMDCPPQNLITLCVSCNVRANYNREYWVELYQGIMTKKYGYAYDNNIERAAAQTD